jgi:hypothetical protein
MENGLINLTNWLGNLLMPTLAGLFFAGAIWRFSKGAHYQHLSYAAVASLMCSGILRLLESFAQQGAWNDPTRFWLSILALVIIQEGTVGRQVPQQVQGAGSVYALHVLGPPIAASESVLDLVHPLRQVRN